MLLWTNQIILEETVQNLYQSFIKFSVNIFTVASSWQYAQDCENFEPLSRSFYDQWVSFEKYRSSDIPNVPSIKPNTKSAFLTVASKWGFINRKREAFILESMAPFWNIRWRSYSRDDDLLLKKISEILKFSSFEYCIFDCGEFIVDKTEIWSLQIWFCLFHLQPHNKQELIFQKQPRK